MFTSEQHTLHLITEDGVTELTVTLFRPEEVGLEDEPEEEYDPEPPGLELWYPEVPFSDN